VPAPSAYKALRYNLGIAVNIFQPSIRPSLSLRTYKEAQESHNAFFLEGLPVPLGMY